MDIFAFPGHIFAGHLIPAAPIYLMALLEMLRAFRLVPRSQYGTWQLPHHHHTRGTVSQGRCRGLCCFCCWWRRRRRWIPGDRTVAWLWMLGATAYSLFHLMQVVAGHHTSSNSMRNGAHVAMGMMATPVVGILLTFTPQACV